MDPASFDVSRKRKQPASAQEEHPQTIKKRNKFGFLLTDEEFDRLLLPKTKKAPVRGKSKKTRERGVGSSDVGESTSDEDANAAREFTVYVQVWAPAQVEKKSGRATKGPPVTIVSKGPFKIDTAQTFQAFKQEVANVLPCRLSMLPTSRFEWKFENQAQSAPRKKVADNAGYEALLDAVKAKHMTDHVVVWLYTPKPAKDENVSMQLFQFRTGTQEIEIMSSTHLILRKKLDKVHCRIKD